MILNLKKNIPYVIVLTILGVLFNYATMGYFQWSSILIMCPIIIMGLYLNQKYVNKIFVRRSKTFDLKKTFYKYRFAAAMGTIASIFMSYFYLHNLSIISCLLFPISFMLTIIIVEHSLYN